MEFVAALSAPGSKCVLSDRAVPLADKDVSCIAEALRDSGIVELYLGGNEITMSGAEDIKPPPPWDETARKAAAARDDKKEK